MVFQRQNKQTRPLLCTVHAVETAGAVSIYTSLEIDLLCNVRFKLVNLHTLLLHAVTVADGNAAVIFTVKVIRDAERRADLILAAIALADGTRIVKVNRKLLCERIVNLAGLFAQLLGERQNRALNGASAGCRRSTTRTSGFSSVPRFSSS